MVSFMKKLIYLSLLLVLVGMDINAQSMSDYLRKPVLEEGENNIILQNRCGNRMTLMFNPTVTDLEFVYKPNAMRRKEFWARNFSNRDNQTLLFTSFSMPDIRSTDVTYEYDPFVTRIIVKAPSGAKNTIVALNIADENAFVLSARSPLLLAFKPHSKFEVSNGLLTEKFTERGEDIVSFIKFPGFEQNRFRILADGTYILQVLENDVIIIGGEENMYQVNRVCSKHEGLNLKEQIARNEEVIKPELANSTIFCQNPDFKKVLDINKRILLSMFDEGGATFGALSRCYFLVWTRDGSMSSSLMARGGFPAFVSDWTKLALSSPSIVRKDDGTEVPEFGQTLGTRWGKSEDDGIFYAALSLFSMVQTTGNKEVLYSNGFEILLESIDRYIEKTWDNNRKMFGSDTRGETTLQSSPYFGYDVVNGEMYHNFLKDDVNITSLVYSYSLYQQVNSYNLMLMAKVLLASNTALDKNRSERYAALAKEVQNTIKTKFKKSNGTLYAGFELFANGSEKWISFGPESDYWEQTWANTLGPYYPYPAAQLLSAKEIKNDWAKYRNYGYCPWNTLSGYLYEYGMSSNDYEKMLSEQIKDALTLTKKFPMKGAVTEYQEEVNGWRALPFQIGALYQTVTSHIIKNMPMGIGVRASMFVDSIQNYNFKLAVISATQTGKGDVVKSFKINGKEIKHTLQIPSNILRNGQNSIEVVRDKASDQFRLYSSTAELRSCTTNATDILYEFNNPILTQLVFENAGKIKSFTFTDKDGKEIAHTKSKIADKMLIELDTKGDFNLVVSTISE